MSVEQVCSASAEVEICRVFRQFYKANANQNGADEKNMVLEGTSQIVAAGPALERGRPAISPSLATALLAMGGVSTLVWCGFLAYGTLSLLI